MEVRYHRVLILIVTMALSGCAVLPQHPEGTRPTPPDRYTLLSGQLVIHSDFALAAEHRVLEDLTARRLDLGRQLALPLSSEPVHVYLFESAERFNAFMRLSHPDFPQRRAFFVETDTRLIVYAHWADRVAEDLRHEVTHAYLHAVVPQLPLWLDEGLAEYFEVPRGHEGINRPHLERLAGQLQQGRWRPDLPRLERFQSSFDMGQDDYAEAWAWAHFLLHSRLEHRELLQNYLADLRRQGSAEPLSQRLNRMLGQPEAALIEYFRQLSAGGPR